jgi:hypothetical protein
MRTHGGHFTVPAAPQVWTRRKLQVLLAATTAAAVALTAGGAWSVAAMLRTTSSPRPTTDADRTTAATTRAQDRLAAAALPPATLEQARPGPLSTGQVARLPLPAASRIGPANVATGFPQTPAGAMAQLVAIDQAAIQSASVGIAQQVIENWAAPDGPTAQDWSGVRAVTELLSAAGLAGSGTAALALSLSPTMGFVKGHVGDAFVVPCVDFVVTATLAAETNRVAVADCQRMTWQADRWVIGAGSEPAPAPSLWPGTQESFDAGYLWLGQSR